MTPHARTAVLVALLAAFGLALATPAQAIYIETPLILIPDRDHAEVDEDVDFDIAPNPNNDTYQPQWAGKKVHVRYSYDQYEGSGAPDEPTSDAGYIERDIVRDVQLDGNASGRFTWRIPAEVDDRNVNVFLEDDNGERLAFAFLAIGNATPMMHLLAASGGMSDDGAEGDDDGSAGAPADEAASDASAEAPSFGIIALMVLLSASALGLTVLSRRA